MIYHLNNINLTKTVNKKYDNNETKNSNFSDNIQQRKF